MGRLRGGELISYPRAAFLPDTFYEVNGVANTSRYFEAFAKRRQIPFLSVHCGPAGNIETDGAVTVMELKRSSARIGLDANLDYDPLLFRHSEKLLQQIAKFGADLIHITGPGDLGTLGFYAARHLKLPLVISWHTSLHEYAARRFERQFGFLGRGIARSMGRSLEYLSLQILKRFYARASIVLAPTPELVDWLHELTGRPVFLMRRGVDTECFTPARRKRITNTFRLGYVGRLTTEKNVRFLAELGTALQNLGRSNFEIVIVGEGREEAWLRKHVPHAVLTGVLRGESLAEAYADMDLFVFPSKTDTFGNVVYEALASGVPAVVTNQGGPKFLIESGVTGIVANSDREFITAVSDIMSDGAMHRRMREAARKYASKQSWDGVFEEVLAAYAQVPNRNTQRVGCQDALLCSRCHERSRS